MAIEFFGSDSNHCNRLAAGFIVVRDGLPVLDDQAHKPRAKVVLAKPDHFLLRMSGVPLGVALGVHLGVERDALDRAIDVLADKSARRLSVANRDQSSVQQAITEAEGKLGAARAYVFESTRQQ